MVQIHKSELMPIYHDMVMEFGDPLKKTSLIDGRTEYRKRKDYKAAKELTQQVWNRICGIEEKEGTDDE